MVNLSRETGEQSALLTPRSTDGIALLATGSECCSHGRVPAVPRCPLAASSPTGTRRHPPPSCDSQAAQRRGSVPAQRSHRLALVSRTGHLTIAARRRTCTSDGNFACCIRLTTACRSAPSCGPRLAFSCRPTNYRTNLSTTYHRRAFTAHAMRRASAARHWPCRCFRRRAPAS